MSTRSRLADVIRIYEGSDGSATLGLYQELSTKGTVGVIAMNLFRAKKNSERAKGYRGGIPGQGSYRGMAYRRKERSMAALGVILESRAGQLGITWGWKRDRSREAHAWVLYVETPAGQVSFHTEARGVGPDYPGEWDGENQAAERIIRWCAALLEGRAPVVTSLQKTSQEKASPRWAQPELGEARL